MAKAGILTATFLCCLFVVFTWGTCNEDRPEHDAEAMAQLVEDDSGADSELSREPIRAAPPLAEEFQAEPEAARPSWREDPQKIEQIARTFETNFASAVARRLQHYEDQQTGRSWLRKSLLSNGTIVGDLRVSQDDFGSLNDCEMEQVGNLITEATSRYEICDLAGSGGLEPSQKEWLAQRLNEKCLALPPEYVLSELGFTSHLSDPAFLEAVRQARVASLIKIAPLLLEEVHFTKVAFPAAWSNGVAMEDFHSSDLALVAPRHREIQESILQAHREFQDLCRRLSEQY